MWIHIDDVAVGHTRYFVVSNDAEHEDVVEFLRSPAARERMDCFFADNVASLDDRVFVELAQLPRLRAFHMFDCAGVRGIGLGSLVRARFVSLAGGAFAPEALFEVASLPELRALKLARLRLEPEHLAALAAHPRLEHLLVRTDHAIRTDALGPFLSEGGTEVQAYPAGAWFYELWVSRQR
ncbi:MAG: hypothetical protein K8H88_28585 [Sandaracinaceae bacterium]|nr:hypothetical protein [Sandaracinaceae bacterium]